MLDSTSNMHPTLRFKVRLMSKLRSTKDADVCFFLHNHNSRSPATPEPRDSEKAGMISRFCAVLVLKIHAMSNISKIGNRVVPSIPVDVVNAPVGPHAGYVQYGKSLSKVKFLVNPDTHVSVMSNVPCNTSYPHPVGFVAGLFKPNKLSCVGGVPKKFAQPLCGKINISHAVSPIKKWFGQKPGSVSALAGLRHFSLGVSECRPL